MSDMGMGSAGVNMQEFSQYQFPASKEDQFATLSRVDSMTSSQFQQGEEEPETPTPLKESVPATPASESLDRLPRMAKIRPNRRVGSRVELGGIDRMSEYNARLNGLPSDLRSRRMSVHRHAVQNFRSPIGAFIVLLGLNIKGLPLIQYFNL
jgi:hypothetical protein